MTDYKFTVRCPNGTAKVIIWKTGDIDPGKEYLRLVTGTANPDCTVQDYNPAQDYAFPVEEKEGGGAIWDGLNPIKFFLPW